MGNNFTPYYPLYMNRINKKINLVYKVKEENTVKSGVVDRL